MNPDRNGHRDDGDRCPTCGAAVQFVVNGRCRECGCPRTIAIIERIEPEEGEGS